MDEDDWDDEAPWLSVGSAETLHVPDVPRFRSVSESAHRAIQIGKAMQAAEHRRPIGFHRPSK